MASVGFRRNPKGPLLFTHELSRIGHFRITSGLVFEASLGAYLFICKINFHSHENEFNVRVNGNCFAYERMSTKTRFENEA